MSHKVSVTSVLKFGAQYSRIYYSVNKKVLWIIHKMHYNNNDAKKTFKGHNFCGSCEKYENYAP